MPRISKPTATAPFGANPDVYFTQRGEPVPPIKQELISTHRGPNQVRPRVQGMNVREIAHEQYGSAIFVKPEIGVTRVADLNRNNIEILEIDLGNIRIFSLYTPQVVSFAFDDNLHLDQTTPVVVIGDFNSHNTHWGYGETNLDGELVEEWSELNHMSLIHDLKEPPSFNSGRWKRGYNPDLGFVSFNIAHLSN